MKLPSRLCKVGLLGIALVTVASTVPAETRPGSEDVTLKSLALNGATFTPGFSPGRTSYTAHVPHSVDSVTVTAELARPDTTGRAEALRARLTVNGGPAASGEASPPVRLEVGRNLVPIEVTTQDGKTKTTYVVKVIRSYPTPTWVNVAEACPWLPRDSAGELVFKGRMWLFGGYTPEIINDVWCSADGTHWTQVGTIPNTSGVNIPVNFVHDDRMWVSCADGALFSSPDGVDWTLATNEATWRSRYAAGGVAFADKMWVMGGLKEGCLFNDVWSSPDGVHWTLEVEEAPWSKRQIFAMAAVHDNKMWLLGGGITVYHPFKAYNDVWCSPDGARWTQVTPQAPWTPRIWAASAVYKNRLWVLGGFRAEPAWENFNDVWYSADGANWNQLITETVWSPRHEVSAYVFDDKLWVVAGNAWPLQQDVWCLDVPGLVFLTQPVIEEFVTAGYCYRARADFNQSGGKVRYRLLENPAWLDIEPETGLIKGAPNALGDFPITIEAYDDAGETARQTYTLHVVPVG